MEREQDFPQAEVGGTCIICKQHKDVGIHIFSQFLCTDCEQEIVHTDVEDERYPYYIDRMKQIWMELIT